jgi:Tfp pilus assembly protein PilP
MKLTRSLMIATLASGTLWAQAPPKPAATPANSSATTQTAKPPATDKAAPATKPAPAAAKPTAATAKPATAAAKPAPASAKPAPAGTTPTTTKAAVAPAKPEKEVHATTKPPAVVKPVPVVVAKTPAPAKKPAVAEAHKPAVVEKKKPSAPKVVKAEAPKPVAKPASVKEETTTRVSSNAGKRDPFVSPIVRATSTGGPVCETGKRCLMVDQIQLKGIVKSPNGYIAVVENALKRAYFLRENDPVFNGSVVKITGDSVVFRESTTDKLGKQGTREVVKKVNAPVV